MTLSRDSAELEQQLQGMQNLGLNETSAAPPDPIPRPDPATQAFVTSDEPNEAALRLSEEALDLILAFLREMSPTSSVILRTFAAFCLVSRTWHESGQRALYRSPLASVDATYTFNRATKLETSLKNNWALAGHVRSLVKLADATIALSRVERGYSFRPAAEKAFLWECSILRAVLSGD